jgi:FlaA1/EpsC-like NDP-sugar epimerase
MLLDRDEAALEDVHGGLAKQFGKDVIRSAICDVTDEAQVQAAFDACAREFGGARHPCRQRGHRIVRAD